jgi:RNA polymerase sigma-70 factor, ECF subfamily
VNGAAGALVAPHGRPFSVMSFNVRSGKIVEIDVLADPVRLRRLDLKVLGV